MNWREIFPAGGKDQAYFTAIPLYDGVGTDGVCKTYNLRSIEQILNRDAQAARAGTDAFKEANGQIMRCGRYLDRFHPVITHKKTIGEGSTGINCYCVCYGFFSLP
jgi:hypothetical protein